MEKYSSAMFRDGDSLVFQRVTGGLRKPIVRFRLSSGRQVELLAFHLEPAWAFAGESPRPITRDVVRRLYPNERPFFVGETDNATGSAYVCIAYLYSDTPVGLSGSALDYSVLLLCALVENIDAGVRGIISELLSQVDWDTSAINDSMW